MGVILSCGSFDYSSPCRARHSRYAPSLRVCAGYRLWPLTSNDAAASQYLMTQASALLAVRATAAGPSGLRRKRSDAPPRATRNQASSVTGGQMPTTCGVFPFPRHRRRSAITSKPANQRPGTVRFEASKQRAYRTHRLPTIQTYEHRHCRFPRAESLSERTVRSPKPKLYSRPSPCCLSRSSITATTALMKVTASS
jgi:hypothetical protein